jgi:hypothetical protein
VYSTITVRDETTLNIGSGAYAFTLTFPTERITVRDLIRARVKQEVQDYNTRRPEFFRGLVQPSQSEQTLNGFKVPKTWNIDSEKQCARALEAFERNGFLLLVDDAQVDELDAVIDLEPQTTVTFLKLVPLVGG